MSAKGIEHLKREGFFRALDYWLLVPIMIVTLIGLYVLSQVLSEGFGDAYPLNFYKQMGAVLSGMVIVLVISIFDGAAMRLLSWLIYGVSLLLLIYVRIDGFSMEDVWGADRWMQIPVIGTFQPSELMKVGLAMVSAQIMEKMTLQSIKLWQGTLFLLLVYVPPLLLIMMQPDFGTTMAIAFMAVCMVFVWGIKWRYIMIGLSSAVIAVPVLWFSYLADWQKSRIITFLFPGHDPDASFNLNQSRQAIASGGLSGNTSDYSVHVPVKESDFIYTAVSEHMGFLGTTVLLMMAFFFIVRSYYIAGNLVKKRPASAYMLVGLASVLAIQYIENLGMTVGIMPITGIPLPFVSLGGTAMIVNFIALGIMLNIAAERKMLR